MEQDGPKAIARSIESLVIRVSPTIEIHAGLIERDGGNDIVYADILFDQDWSLHGSYFTTIENVMRGAPFKDARTRVICAGHDRTVFCRGNVLVETFDLGFEDYKEYSLVVRFGRKGPHGEERTFRMDPDTVARVSRLRQEARNKIRGLIASYAPPEPMVAIAVGA